MVDPFQEFQVGHPVTHYLPLQPCKIISVGLKVLHRVNISSSRSISIVTIFYKFSR